jgi:hypothetical protein
MSNQFYNEAALILEIMDALKNNSMSLDEIRQDLYTRKIPESRVNIMLEAAIEKMNSSGSTSIQTILDKNI